MLNRRPIIKDKGIVPPTNNLALLGIMALIILLWFTPVLQFDGGATLNRIIGGGVLVSISLRKLAYKRHFNITAFDKIFYLFVVWVFIGLIANGVTSYTNTQFIGMFMGYLLYFLIIVRI